MNGFQFINKLYQRPRSIISIGIVLFGLFTLFNNFFHERKEKNIRSEYASAILIDENTSNSAYNYNQVNEGIIFNDKNGIYYSDRLTYYFDFKLAKSKVLYKKPTKYFYIYDDKLYGLVDTNYMNITDNEILFSNASKVFQYDHKIIYLNSSGAFYYNLQTGETYQTCLGATDFIVSEKDSYVLYQVSDRLLKYSIDGTYDEDYPYFNMSGKGCCFVEGGCVYYNDESGIYQHNLFDGDTVQLYSTYCDQFNNIMAHNTLIYSKDGKLYLENDDGTTELDEANELYELNSMIVYKNDQGFYTVDHSGQTQKLFSKK